MMVEDGSWKLEGRCLKCAEVCDNAQQCVDDDMISSDCVRMLGS